jgi:hypothetical protein
MLALAVLAIAFWPGNRKLRSYRVRAAMSSVLLMAIGCGGGGSSPSGSGGSTGGGTSGPAVNSTVTISLASSETSLNARVNATATVTASKTPTGSVDFRAENYMPSLTIATPVTNGSLTALLQNPGIGIFQVYAYYYGDSNTNAAQSAAVPFTVTGDGNIYLTTTNGPVTHLLALDAQVQ